MMICVRVSPWPTPNCRPQANDSHPANNPAWAAAMLDRALAMYGRAKNHPCICMWSLGNEAGYGPAQASAAQPGMPDMWRNYR